MSEEQAQQGGDIDTKTVPPTTDEPRWGDPISTILPERQAKLRQLAEAQRAWVASTPDGQRDLEQSAFRGVRLTGAEVFFLAADALAGPEGDLEAAATRLGAAKRDDASTWVDLSSLHLAGANLFGAQLTGANLSEAQLAGASLHAARLAGADLSMARLAGANLSGAQLERADLRGAQLAGATPYAPTSTVTAPTPAEAGLGPEPQMVRRIPRDAQHRE